jgi:predicted dehydrogenase
MASESLITAVLGLHDRGRDLLKAAAATGCFQIRAVADQDQQRAEKTAGEYKCEAYGDYRQLIVQNQFDCLLVAADIHTCAEYLKAGLRKRFHVLKLAPPARTFEEWLELVQIAQSEGVSLAVANPARFHGSYAAAHDLMARGAVEHASLVTASCRIGAADRPAWRSDPKLAGGGVLLHECYPVVDQILWSFPLPQQVYALMTNQAPDKQQRLYLTEDTAVVCMRFADDLLVNLVAARHDGPEADTASLEIHGKEARLGVTEREVVIERHEEHHRQTWPGDENEQVVLERLLTSFARSLLAPDEHPLASSGAENLRTMAVLAAAYLSARTGFPEEPARILQLAGGLAAGTTDI